MSGGPGINYKDLEMWTLPGPQELGVWFGKKVE